MTFLINDFGILAVFQLIPFLFWTAVQVGIAYAISQLAQKNPKPTTPEPDSFNAPTQREGTKYPIGFGTNWFEAPVVDWWGDVSSSPIVRHYSENKWFNNKRVYYIVGYHYEVGINFLVAQGVYDGFKQIKVGGKVAWPNPDDETELNADGETWIIIVERELFGGNEKEGGIAGTIRFRYGSQTQDQSSYLVSQLGSNVSAYRGFTSAILEKVRIGTSPYLKTWAFLLKRTDVLTGGDEQWYISKADIDGNLNAAHIIHECLTNTDWGMKISSALLPDTEWEAVADTLYDEGFGLSLKWEDQSQTLKQFVQEVLRHIDAKLYEDPTTGEIILKLVRDDYVEDDLDVYNDSDVIEVTDFGRSTIYECINTIQLKYWDLVHNKPISIPNHDIAMMDMQNGKWVEHGVEYLGSSKD